MAKKGVACVGGKETKNLNNREEWGEDKKCDEVEKNENVIEIVEIDEKIAIEEEKNGKIKFTGMIEKLCTNCREKKMHQVGKYDNKTIFQCIRGSCGRTFVEVEKIKIIEK